MPLVEAMTTRPSDRAHSRRKISRLRPGYITAATAFSLLLSACSSDRPASISITPTTTTLEAGDSVLLVVNAQNTDVAWPELVDGSFARSGTQVTYTPPPAEGRYEFTVAATADRSKTATVSIDVFVPPVPEITSFDLGHFAAGIIDQDENTIVFSTHDWIDDLDALVAEFTAVGTVTVDGVPQESGVTPNDFYREVRYTVATGQFSQRTYSVRIDSPQTTGLPIVRIDTEQQQPIVSKEDYVRTNVTVIDPRNPRYSFERTDYRDQVRGRGNSTWIYPKKPYRIRFDKKTSMFGRAAARNWVLLANHQDPTLMMNTIAFELGSRFGLPYTPNYTHVELFLNGEHQGSYLLTEHIQVGEGRVEIDENAGFFVELDTYYDDEPKFMTELFNLPVMIKSPEDLDDPSGYDFVKHALHVLETAMAGPSFPDSGYRNLIDFDTVVDYLLINEIVMNNELAFPKSAYLYRDADGLIGLGPLWDFDWGFGFTGIGHQYFDPPNRLIYKHAFFARFFEDPKFVARYKERWAAFYEQVTSMSTFIEGLAEQLEQSQRHNFWKWPESENNGYEREIGDLLTWWRERIAYLDHAIPALK